VKAAAAAVVDTTARAVAATKILHDTCKGWMHSPEDANKYLRVGHPAFFYSVWGTACSFGGEFSFFWSSGFA
jgi:hypothetical protein